jgi:hypothetical protein
MHIGKTEQISFKIAVNEAAETYGFHCSTAAFHVLNNSTINPSPHPYFAYIRLEVCLAKGSKSLLKEFPVSSGSQPYDCTCSNRWNCVVYSSSVSSRRHWWLFMIIEIK